MAEQVSHNVVNGPESASASALADVSANQHHSAVAADGIYTTNTTTEHATISKNAFPHTADVHEAASNGYDGTDADPSAAEPSAGDAMRADVNVPVVMVSEQGVQDQEQSGKARLVNGVHDIAGQGENAADDGSTADASVDHSVHSDTDGSRADVAELKKEDNHHIRTNSVKKPTTFSKVSVTKQFMAKSASPVPQVVKSGEKPTASSPSVLATAKPRLVAKSGASAQGLQKARVGADGPGRPDASRVWNKNRRKYYVPTNAWRTSANTRSAVPAPPPKQFTDEELKEQYGIHLATRLQTDEDGKESKWADIDEDEEDWAPETVVWMDGTKSTLTPAEVTPVQQEQKPAPSQALKPVEATRPILALKKAGESGPPKTILKPGVAILQAKQQNGAPAVSPGGEKPSLKAKSPAANPSKSPWAVLPPIEAVSPLNPPVQQLQQFHQSASLPTQDARAYEQQPPPQHAREIAADTFDRSWREGEGGTRELFNSSNGRYEPAPEGRRSSNRPESTYRKPAVLQRPSQTGPSPAEPSAGFQSRTGSQVDGTSWPRRRGSSVSHGSMPPARRTSVSKPAELEPPAERRSSAIVGHDLRTSPQLARNEPVKPNFVQPSTWDQQMPPRPEAVTETEDPVKVQERVMREKRELAIKRRKEEEERLEVEKQERLRAKLAALEGAGKSKKEREAEAAAAIVVETPAKGTLPTSDPETTDLPVPPSQPAEASAEAAPMLEAQIAPPTPEPARADATISEDKLPSPLAAKPQALTHSDSAVPAADDQAQQPAPIARLSPKAKSRTPFGQQQPSTYRPPTSSYSSPGERKTQPFGRSPLTNSDSFSPWLIGGTSGGVWSTAGIGNGTSFGKASSFAPVPMAQQTSALPPPPGMGRPGTSARISPQGFAQESRSPSLQQSHVVEQPRAFPLPGIESRSEAAWGQSRQPPIAPPSRAQQQQQPPVQRPDMMAAWHNVAQRLPHEYASNADAAERRKQERVTAPPREDTFKETFKQTFADPQGRLGGPRAYQKTEYTIHDSQGSKPVATFSPQPPSAQTQPIGPVPTASPLHDLHKLAGENTVRIPDGSLNPAHGGLLVQQAPIAPPPSQQVPLTAYHGNVKFPTSPLAPVVGSKDQSPPPPETSSHPVNSGGDSRHPHVKLPPPPPVVKLPPASLPPMRQHTPVMMPQRLVQGFPPGAARPIAMTEDWQARFNGLFNRAQIQIQTEVPPSPPKTPPKAQSGQAMAVAASSKAVMDEVIPRASATVSLPQNVRRNVTSDGFIIDDSSDVVSKPTIEHMFTEELSFGSLPKISLPRNPLYDVDVYGAPPQNNMLHMPTNATFLAQVEAQSQPALDVRALYNKHPAGFFVKLPGTKANRLVRFSNAGGRKGSAPQQQQPHDRKASGKFSRAKGQKDSPSSSSGITTTTSAPSAGPTKPSTLTNAPTPTAASPPASGSPTNAEGGKKKEGKWGRPGRGRNAPVTSS